jgi:hypothetical protein
MIWFYVVFKGIEASRTSKENAEIKECYDPAFYREFVYHFIFDVRVLQHTIVLKNQRETGWHL